MKNTFVKITVTACVLATLAGVPATAIAGNNIPDGIKKNIKPDILINRPTPKYYTSTISKIVWGGCIPPFPPRDTDDPLDRPWIKKI